MDEECGERCWGAQGPRSSCKCECRGENHGALNEGRLLKEVPSGNVPTFTEIGIRGTDPETMGAKKINDELDFLDEERSKMTKYLIGSGRGHERASDIAARAEHGDKDAQYISRIESRMSELRREITSRYGPNAPSRLPTSGKDRKFFGARKKAQEGPTAEEIRADPSRWTSVNIGGNVFFRDEQSKKLFRTKRTGASIPTTPEEEGRADAASMKKKVGQGSREIHARNARLELSRAEPRSEQARYLQAYAETLETE